MRSNSISHSPPLSPSQVMGAVVDIATSLRTSLVSSTSTHNHFGDAGTATIAEALRSNQVLTTLDLSSNGPITAPVDLSGEYDASGIALADVEVNEVRLKTLSLGNNRIRAEGVTAIAEALRGNEVLTTLDLCANDLGDEGKGVIRGAVSGRVRFKLKM